MASDRSKAFQDALTSGQSSSEASDQPIKGGRGKGIVFKWWQLLVMVSLIACSIRLISLSSLRIEQTTSFFQRDIDSTMQVLIRTAQNAASSFDISMFLFSPEDETQDVLANDDSTQHVNRKLPRLNLIPKPTRLKQMPGTFPLSSTTRIFLSSSAGKPEAELLAETLRASTGFDFVIVHGGGCEQGHICLLLLQEEETKRNKSSIFGEEEAYVVDVRQSGAVVGSFSRTGLFYGTQTLLQLLPPSIYSTSSSSSSSFQWKIPLVHIEDAPQYTWRGMHLDVSRHFMPKDFVLKFINLLAIHKLNSLHLHLSDDQGWRLEIRRYPLLTNISAFRDETVIGHNDDHPRRYDGKRYGGFFTQQDIREIVAFAAKRHVNVVPEIEMPGHTVAVFAAYPEYSCRPDLKYVVKREWGVSDDVFCVGKDETFVFLEHILEEVMELFPSEYIHIGGDECPKIRWAQCPLCKKRMRDENLNTLDQLQSYFIKRIETFLNSRGRKMIGWDEIFEGGLAPRATVMSWRGTDPAMKAAQRGHNAILAPVGITYFDWYPTKNTTGEPLAWGGYTPLQTVYKFEPIPQNAPLSPDKYHFVLGGQGQLWTEYMPDSKQVEYMAFPRAAALAEALWAKRRGDIGEGEYEDFFERLLKGHLPRLDALKVNYRIPTKMFE